MKAVDELEPPRWMPPGAVLRLTEPIGSGLEGEIRLGARHVARILWNNDGSLSHEQYADLEGRNHGVERERFWGRYTIWVAEWVHGVMQGPSILLDESGAPITVALFEGGRGVDVFGDREEGIGELRELSKNGRHGLELWGEPDRPSSEQFFAHGKAHGILRRWDLDDGTLDPDHPKFFVNGNEVTADAYAAAAAVDPTLRPHRPEDDGQARAIPACLTDALQRAAEWAPTFDLARYIAEADAALAALWQAVDPETPPEEPA